LDLHVGKLCGEDIQRQYVTDVIFGKSEFPDELKGGIKAGAHESPIVQLEMQTRLNTLLGWLGESGVTAVILGCTELSLVLGDRSQDGIPLVDPLEVAASSAVKIAAGDRSLPT
jgi:aspartate/glutamate racemase